MKVNAYYNGIYAPIESIQIPLTDRCVYFGDGIYEAMIGRNNKIFMLNEHIERFFSNVTFLDLGIDLSKNELEELLYKIIQKSELESYFVYFQLTRFLEKRTHSYEGKKSNLLITVTPFSVFDNPSELKLISTKDNRHGLCSVKTLNLLPAVIASKYASDHKCDEAVFVKNGKVTECAHSNIHILKDGKLITRGLDGSILPGIARAHLIKVAEKMKIPVIQRPFTVEEIIDSDATLISSSSKLLIPASEIDGVRLAYNNSELAFELKDRVEKDFFTSTS